MKTANSILKTGEMLGWFVVHPGAPLIPEPETVKLHKKSFPKKKYRFHYERSGRKRRDILCT